MTPPPATTAAARKASAATARKPSQPSNAAAGAARAQSAASPNHARPVGSREAAATRLGTARTRTPERTARHSVRQPAVSPRAPRRVSGPARPIAERPVSARPATDRATPERATSARAGATRPMPASARVPKPNAARRGPASGVLAIGRLPGLIRVPRPRLRADALLDRIVRSRAWIPVLGVALIGIVVIQVEVLKLGASTGRSMNTATELSSQIQLERAQVSSLASPSRIERLAETYGLAQPGPTDNHFVSGATPVQKAINGIHPVDASAFASNLAQEQAVDDLAPTQAVAAANATDASPTPSPADDAATGSSAAAESQVDANPAAPASAAAGTTLTNTAADPAAAADTTGASTDTADATGATGATTDTAGATGASVDATGATTAPSSGGSGLAGAAVAASSGTSGTLTN